MVKVKVACVGVGCDKVLPLDTENPDDWIVDAIMGVNAPLVFIKTCPKCGKRNKVRIPK